MPRFTIDLSAKAVQKLQPQVQRTNDTNGSTLTLKDWIVLHLKELAIADDLGPAVDLLATETQDTLAAAIRAKRDQLLQELELA